MKEVKEMTIEEKKSWLTSASDEELVKQLMGLVAEEAVQCSYGERQKDIELTKAEIMSRMAK